jgi:hypothetical protein
MNIEAREKEGTPHHPGSRAYTLGVRMKFGDELAALDIHSDGITFRAPAAIQPGKVVELILCNGSILVDAIIIQCAPIRDDEGGYAIRARYHHASEALTSLIFAEIQRITGGMYAG